MGKFLNATQASKQMGISSKAVSDLCKRGALPGAKRTRKNGPWRIPAESVNGWVRKQSAPQGFEIFQLSQLKTIIVVVVGVISFLGVVMSIGNDYQGAQQQLQRWGVLPAFRTASEGEILIIIAKFDVSKGAIDTKIHEEIQKSINEAIVKLASDNLRVEIEPRTIASNDQETARTIAKRYNASIIIWGADTGTRVEVNFLSLKEPDFESFSAQRSEARLTQLANPKAYSRFVTTELPAQLNALAFHAIGRSFMAVGEYENAIDAFRIVVTHSSKAYSTEDIGNIYYLIGWLYQYKLNNYSQSIEAYTKAIEFNPNDSGAYNNRGIILANQGDLDAALADFNEAIRIDPASSNAYSNRGITLGYRNKLEDALADFNKAVELEPTSPEVYYNRGIIWDKLDDIETAVADYNKALELNPGFQPARINLLIDLEKISQ